MKKIIFMGTPEFSTTVLEKLIQSDDYEVIAAVTQPDRPVGRKKIMTPSPVKKLAMSYDIPVYQPEKLSGSSELEILMLLEADLIVTAAYGQFLPKKFLEMPRYGAVNVHASLLPKYRGGAPIHYAIMNGDAQTGVTIMRMISKMDAGNILSQHAIPITKSDDVATMFEKLSDVGAELLMTTLPSIFDGTVQEVVQDELLVTFSPNITREQEQINWEKSATMVDCFIRGLRPWPTSYTVLDGERVKIWEAVPVEERSKNLPGTIWVQDHRLLVACGEQTVLEVKELQPAGKAKMSALAFMNGFAHVLEGKPRFEGVQHG